MGFKAAAVLLGLLILVGSGSAWYIDRLQDNISTLKANAIALESSIKQQNEAIKAHLAKAEQTQAQVNKLSQQNLESQREVNKLRSTFAKHDLDNLALAKPALIQKIVNKGTKKVKEELIELTNPTQFDETEDEESNNS